MRVALVCSSFGGGGAEKVAVKLSNALDALGYDVMYIYWTTKKDQEYTFTNKVKLYKIAGNPLYRVWAIRRLLIFNKPDAILSFTDIPNIITFFSCAIAWPFKCLRVPNVRTNVRAKYFNSSKSPYTRFLFFLHGLSCKRASVVLVNSEDSGIALCEYYQLSFDKVRCIYNPVFDVTPDKKLRLERTKKSRNQQINAISIGRLTEAKDQKTLIYAVDYAFNQLGLDITLDIYGEGELYDDLLEIIVDCNLSDRIFIKSFDPYIENKIKNYHLFLLSSRWEGLPNALIEALGSGVDIVSTDCHSGPREILDNGRFGHLVEIGNYQEMAETIENIYREGSHDTFDGGRHESLGDELTKHLEKFNISFVTSQYYQIISGRKDEL